jgi:hypothetical protein
MSREARNLRKRTSSIIKASTTEIPMRSIQIRRRGHISGTRTCATGSMSSRKIGLTCLMAPKGCFPTSPKKWTLALRSIVPKSPQSKMSRMLTFLCHEKTAKVLVGAVETFLRMTWMKI